MGDAMEIDESGGGTGGADRSMDMEVQRSQQVETASLRHEAPNPGMSRRRSMSHEDQKQRRASIKAIMANTSITPQERRRSIQHLMDGRRSSIGTASVASSSAGTTDSNPYGYGNAQPDYGYGAAAPDSAANQYDYGYEDAGPTPRNHDNETNANGMGYGESSYMNDGEVCVPICNENTKRAEMTRPPCNHYARNCTLVSHCW